MQASGRRSAIFILALAAVLAAPAAAVRQDVPADSTPMTVTYHGSFDLTNTMVPQGMPHTFSYHVDWTYSWSGTWGELFAGSPTSLQTSFGGNKITGTIQSQWRTSPAGPNVTCTQKILPSKTDYPDFRASYNLAKGSLKIDGLESPTFRYGRVVSSTRDPMCGGGPEIDMFSVPASWSPLGQASATVPLTGGVHAYDHTWKWHHTFNSEERRDYTSSMHTVLQVSVPGTG